MVLPSVPSSDDGFFRYICFPRSRAKLITFQDCSDGDCRFAAFAIEFFDCGFFIDGCGVCKGGTEEVSELFTCIKEVRFWIGKFVDSEE